MNYYEVKPFIGQIAKDHPMNKISRDTKEEMAESGKVIAKMIAETLAPIKTIISVK